MENFAEIQQMLNQVNLLHYTAGRIRQRLERIKAEQYRDTNELQAIYHLTESHAPEFRFKSLLQYYKICDDDQKQSLFENCLGFNCNDADTDNCVNSLLMKLSEMPKQWTIVQLTSHISVQQSIEINNNKFYTNPIDLTLFECGRNRRNPILIKINEPRDAVNGSVVELAQEMYSIIVENKKNLMVSKERQHFVNASDKHDYYNKRIALDDRLKKMVQDIQNLWLKHWRCLFIGKFINEQLEIDVSNRISDYFKNELSMELKPKILSILTCIAKGCHFLKLVETKLAVEYCFPGSKNKNFISDCVEFLMNLNCNLSLSTQKRYPVILIIDDNLDFFPWEMLDVLIDVPVSRAPLFHLIYLLFKTHEHSIVDGYKIVNNPKNGRFILNPDLDLTSMESRMMQFFNYYLPEWSGIIGKKPTVDEFNDSISSCEIFAYMGHGSGAHLISTNIIQDKQINAVVLLFGCGSTKLNKIGPQVEMYGHHQLYLMAKSPCIIGMLWEVTDLDTDILTTEILSNSIPCPNKTHWSCVDKSIWKKGVNVNFEDVIVVTALPPYEPDLLQIISTSKKATSYYLTKAACVARGIPVKIQQLS